MAIVRVRDRSAWSARDEGVGGIAVVGLLLKVASVLGL
jgi:hypothetical protein